MGHVAAGAMLPEVAGRRHRIGQVLLMLLAQFASVRRALPMRLGALAEPQGRPRQLAFRQVSRQAKLPFVLQEVVLHADLTTAEEVLHLCPRALTCHGGVER